MCVFGKPARKPQRSDLSKGKPIKSNLYLYASYSKYKYMNLNASVSNKSKNNSSNWILVVAYISAKMKLNDIFLHVTISWLKYNFFIVSNFSLKRNTIMIFI